MLRFLRNWFLLSLPLGLFVARFIAVGQRKGALRREDERGR
ncbi:hypothetical protein [Methylobacterium nigriterrae]